MCPKSAKKEVEARLFWLKIAEDNFITRVVCDGHHYTAHEPGYGGFGGNVFRIDWEDTKKHPTICSLLHQGEVPQWIRQRLHDNARITDLSYSINTESPLPDDDDVPF